MKTYRIRINGQLFEVETDQKYITNEQLKEIGCIPPDHIFKRSNVGEFDSGELWFDPSDDVSGGQSAGKKIYEFVYEPPFKWRKINEDGKDFPGEDLTPEEQQRVIEYATEEVRSQLPVWISRMARDGQCPRCGSEGKVISGTVSPGLHGDIIDNMGEYDCPICSEFRRRGRKITEVEECLTRR